MSVEERIRQLTEDIIACRDEAEAVILTRDLGIALHEHIKELRRKLRLVRDCGSLLPGLDRPEESKHSLH